MGYRQAGWNGKRGGHEPMKRKGVRRRIHVRFAMLLHSLAWLWSIGRLIDWLLVSCFCTYLTYLYCKYSVRPSVRPVLERRYHLDVAD